MSTRDGIYYWKCDRPAAFHGIATPAESSEIVADQLHRGLSAHFPGRKLSLSPGHGQGNHRTFQLELDERAAFIRLEDGPEHDDYFDVEATLIARVGALGVPVPAHIASDTSRRLAPFAWQVLGRVPAQDLNHHLKAGVLPLPETAEKIGALVGTWQTIRPKGFGPFDAARAREGNTLAGLHPSYEAYFRLNLERHLHFLVQREFISQPHAEEILREIATHETLLQFPQGCLVHKDLALWNILGTPKEILAVIDWDDAISGDPMDDLSLLGCFYDGDVLRRAFAGYASVRALPEDYHRRFWLHLLRNMIVKSVIRVGAGYFEKSSSFFLIGSNGDDLKTFTLRRLSEALDGLRADRDPCEL